MNRLHFTSYFGSFLECTGKADIVFILDSSSSEGAANFQKQLDFVKNFTSNFDIGHDKTQFSITTFSSAVHHQFWLNQHLTSASLSSAISAIPYISGNTYTHEALEFVRLNSFKPQNGGRSDAEHVVIVLTDGQAQYTNNVTQQAALLHHSGVEVLSVGIGSGTNQNELLHIASDAQHVFSVSSFDALHTIQSELQQATCLHPTVC